MRVLQVAPCISRANAYGGPVAVAINQCQALADLGHRVVLATGDLDRADPVSGRGFDTVHFKSWLLSRRKGFATLCTPVLVMWVCLRANRFDRVHLHLARDLTMLPCLMLLTWTRAEIVVQTHGMVQPRRSGLGKIFDRLFVSPLLRRCATVFHLTQEERVGLRRLGVAEESLRPLPNGVPVRMLQPAQAATRPNFVFLARLHERKNPLMFVEAVDHLAAGGGELAGRVVGADEGQGAAVRARIAVSGASLSWVEGVPRDETAVILESSDCLVLPARDEPFPMAVLEAMERGLPVVVTDTCGLAEAVRAADAGAVVRTEDQADLERAMRVLAEDPHTRFRQGVNARRLVETAYDMKVVARLLVEAYESGPGGSSRG